MPVPHPSAKAPIRACPNGQTPRAVSLPWLGALATAASCILLSPTSALAFARYTAELVWDRNAAATSYDVNVRFVQGAGGPPTEKERTVSFLASSTPIGRDGKVHVAIGDLPVGPTAIFSILARKDGAASPRSNEIALTYATVARYVDSDGDGLLDYEEDLNLDLIVDSNETDPNKADTDGDGLSDYDELYRTFTNPRAVDSDGDGISDSLDTCNDIDRDGFGSAVSGIASCKRDNCPFHYNPNQRDSDFDGTGDACDPCTNAVGEQTFDAGGVALTFRNVLSDKTRGNDVLKFRGEFQLPPGLNFSNLDLSASGARILVTNVYGKPILDAKLPPGAFRGAGNPRGWESDGRGRAYRYKDKTTAPIHGINKALLKNVGPKSASRTVRVAIRGTNGDYPVRTDAVPFTVTVILGDASASEYGACGESNFGLESCRGRAVRSTLVCR
jgi:hypothetical protein